MPRGEVLLGHMLGASLSQFKYPEEWQFFLRTEVGDIFVSMTIHMHASLRLFILFMYVSSIFSFHHFFLYTKRYIMLCTYLITFLFATQ